MIPSIAALPPAPASIDGASLLAPTGEAFPELLTSFGEAPEAGAPPTMLQFVKAADPAPQASPIQIDLLPEGDGKATLPAVALNHATPEADALSAHPIVFRQAPLKVPEFTVEAAAPVPATEPELSSDAPVQEAEHGAPSSFSPTPTVSHSTFPVAAYQALPAPRPDGIPLAATGRATGPARKEQAPAASTQGSAQRSDRADVRGGPVTAALPQRSTPTLEPVSAETPLVPLTTAADGDAPAQIAIQPPATAAPAPGPASFPAARPVEHAPAEAPSISFTSPRFAEDVGVAIARRVVDGGADEMLLRIEPADLGRIQVQLHFDEQGALQATITADQPRVLEQLRLGAAELHRALADAGVRGEVAPPRFEGRADQPSGGATSGFTGNPQDQGQSPSQQQGHRAPHPAFRHDWSSDASAAFVPLALAGGRVDLIA